MMVFGEATAQTRRFLVSLQSVVVVVLVTRLLQTLRPVMVAPVVAQRTTRRFSV
jgi:hypothetical protein